MKSLIPVLSQITFLFLSLFLVNDNSLAQKSRVKKIESQPAGNEVVFRNEQPTKDYLMHLANNRLEDVSKRTKYSKTMDQGNGHFDLYQSNTPIHYSDNGEWKDINPRIELIDEGFIEGYKYSNLTNSFKSYYPEALSNGLLIEFGNEKMRDFLNARIVYENTNGIEISSVSINNSAFPVKDRETSLRYDDVYPNINLRVGNMNSLRKTDYFIENNSFIENIPEGVNKVIFEEGFELPVGWTAVMKDQKIMILDESQNYLAHYETPKVFEFTLNDELPNTSNGDLPYVGFELKQNGTIYTLRIILEAAWLNSPNRTFPIVIDPDVTVDQTSFLYTYNDMSSNSPKEIPINMSSSATVSGVVTDYDVYIFDGFAAYNNMGVPVWYFEGQGYYSYSQYPQYVPLTSTAASGSSRQFPNGSVSSYFVNFDNTSNFDCEDVNQNFTYTIGNTASLPASVGWYYYTKISYVDLSSISASASASLVCDGGTVNLSSTPSSTTADASLPSASCSATGSTSYETSVTLFTFDDLSGEGIYKSTPTQTNAYEDFTATSNGYANVQRGGSYTMGMNVNTDGPYTVQGFVWIDWNNNGDFTDAGEDYDMGSAYNTADGATSAGMVAVSVPSDAAYGYHRIRVGARYGTTDPSSCNSGIDGEFEDYSLYVFGSHTYAHSWSSSPAGLSSSDQNPQNISVSANTTYTVSVSSGGCSSTATASVTANGLPSNSSVAISSASTPPRNNDDITATISTSDPESAAVYSENDWRVDGSSFAVQNFSFDANGSDGLTSNSSQGGALTAYGDATQVAGVKGQAYEFDGDTDYLQNSSLNIDPTQGLSVSLWTYTESLGSGAQRWFNLGGDGSGELFVLRKTSSNAVEGYIKTGGNHSNWCSGCSSGDFIYLNGQVTTGSNNTGWQHWVMTWDGQTSNGQMKLYLDGSLIHTTTTASGGLIPITSLNINQNNSTGWNGKLDELLIFERDISADQVTALYNSGTPSYSTIANDETSCGESWALSSNPVDAAGCSGSTTTSTAVSISGAQVTTADVTDVTTCGLDNYAIAIDDANDVGVWEVSPANAALIDDPSAPSTTVTASPVANPTSGFNSDLTFTWTPTDNSCASDNVMIKFNQPVISGTMDNYCWAWGGGTNSNWSTGSNWYKWDGSKWAIQSSSYPDAGSKVYILPSSQTCVTNGAINASASLEDLTLQGGSFDLGSANTSITGDIINDGGTLQGGSGTVTLNGSGAQSITGSGVNTNFNNLIINNSNNISSDIQIVVENELTMISGNINNSSPLILGSSSANSGILNHTTGIITGEFRRYFPNATGSQMFPVGTSSVMRDVSVNFTSAPGTNQYLTASYVTGAPTLFGGGDYEGLPLVTEDGQLIQNYDNEGHWVINPTNDDYSSSINGKAYTISLHMNNISDATDYTKTRIIKSAGSNTASQHHLSWGALTGQSVSGYNGAAPSNSNFAVTATSTGFSVFGAGSDDGDPLPVELVSFTGNCADGVVDVTWTTASEFNSSHFELENSRDGITWDVVYTKDAAGQSTELIEYTYNDVHANGGDNYYRLTQVDIDGTSKTYDVINASCSQTTSGYFSIFPNPSSGSFQVILNNAEIIGDARMNVVDTKGNMVLSKPLDVKSGINMYVVNEVLAPGIYYVSVQNGDKVTVVLKHSVK
ncbi:GEVED domain-containing protein [Crocinitomicaceae bacterium]|nr:GEVED domain-containing protein [Crocinitomicaceae bacterium]